MSARPQGSGAVSAAPRVNPDRLPAAVRAQLAVHTTPDLLSRLPSDLPSPADLPREAEKLQASLGFSDPEMGERFGISRASWCNVKGGRQWTSGLKNHHADIWRKLQAEAMARKDRAGAIEVAQDPTRCTSTRDMLDAIEQEQPEPTEEPSIEGPIEGEPDTDRAARMAEAERFLLALDEEAEFFTFQTFDDLESRKSKHLAAIQHGTLEQWWDWLEAQNQSGAGIFVTVNATDRRGREVKNITRVRACFADFDPPKTAAAPAQYPLPPMIEVESSPGKRHAYWLVDDMPLEAFKPMQQAVIAALGSDPAPNDLPRVMRLPGFRHMKDPANPAWVRLLSVEPRLPYTADELERVFQPQAAHSQGPQTPSDGRTQDDYLAELMSGENVHDAALKIVGRMVRDGVTNATIKATFAVLAEKVAESRGADRAAALMGDELERMIRGARAKGYEAADSANPANSANRDRANITDPDDESPLSLAEIEQLVAWSWRTKTALPTDPEGVFTYHHNRDAKGRLKERYSMRSPIVGLDTFSGPWPALAWKHGREGFMGAVDAYLPVREQHVLAEAERTGKAPNDAPRDVLRADAQAWMRRIDALPVSDEVGRELQERVTPDWPEPEPLRAPMTEAEPYPVNALGDVLGTAAIALHESVKAPLALCAQSVLAAASFAAQAHFDAHMPWGEIKPLSLAMLTVGESGERKSGVDDLVLGAAKAQERAEMSAHEADMESFESEMAAWKAASEQAKKRASGKDRGKLEDFRREAAEVGPPPVAPVLPLRFVTDPTVEGLYKLLAIGQPSVALFSDEGGLLIGGHALNSDNALKTLARWCKLWDGSPFDRVRAGDGSGILYGRRMALHQLAQPDIMSTLLSDPTANGQGFLARCLVAWPQSTIGTRHIEQYEWAGGRSEIKRLFGKLKTLFETPPRAKDQRGQVLDPQPLPLSPDAKAMAVQAGNQFESLMAPGAPLCEIRDRGSKAIDNAIRIAGVLTVIEQGLAAREISAEHFARALTLIQWYLAEALRIRGAAAIPQTVTDAEALLAWIKERGISLFRSAHVLTRGPAQLRNKVRFTAAVAELVSNGYLVEASPGTEVDGVKAKLAWRVHPHVL